MKAMMAVATTERTIVTNNRLALIEEKPVLEPGDDGVGLFTREHAR